MVSVPANIVAETQEVILSLVEGGKLTSGIMKDYGVAIREHKPVSMPVNLDLKISVNGQELKNHEERSDEKSADDEQTEVGQKDRISTPKETDGDIERKDDEGSTSNKEMKGVETKGYGFIEDCWEERICKLREAAKKFLVKSKSYDYVYIEATFSDQVVVCHTNYDEKN